MNKKRIYTIATENHDSRNYHKDNVFFTDNIESQLYIHKKGYLAHSFVSFLYDVDEVPNTLYGISVTCSNKDDSEFDLLYSRVFTTSKDCMNAIELYNKRTDDYIYNMVELKKGEIYND